MLSSLNENSLKSALYTVIHYSTQNKKLRMKNLTVLLELFILSDLFSPEQTCLLPHDGLDFCEIEGGAADGFWETASLTSSGFAIRVDVCFWEIAFRTSGDLATGVAGCFWERRQECHQAPVHSRLIFATFICSVSLHLQNVHITSHSEEFWNLEACCELKLNNAT